MITITAPHRAVTYLASRANSLPEMFALRTQVNPHRAAFFAKQAGRWIPTTWQQFDDAASKVAAGLIELGLEVNDRVAILGPTRPEWAIQDMGAQMAGCISLGIYPKQSAKQVRFILEHSEARVIFVADATELKTVLEAANGLKTLEAIVPWSAELLSQSNDPRMVSPDRFAGAPLTDAIRADRQARRGADDTAIFVYTSGTTGPPKCAMISHGNILSVMSNQEGFGFFEDDVSLSFLPMAHVAERILAFYGRINAGFATCYATSISMILSELAEVRPTIFGSVPRIFEKAYTKIQTGLSKKPPAVQKLFAWADGVGRRRARLQLADQTVPLSLSLQHKIADRLVFSKIRAAFGGRVRIFITGAAPTPLDILEFFWGAGLPIYEVYGMTEATVITHSNLPGATKLGTVGQVIPQLEHRIADDGEILLKGPFVFQGYFKDPETTAETIKNGWLYTGDIGTIDPDGYLRITDRKKHLIITAGGKNLTPSNIENAIKPIDPLIGIVHAHGDRRPYITALLIPSPLETLDFGRDRGLVTDAEYQAREAELMESPTTRTEALANAMAPVTEHPDFIKRAQAAVSKGNKSLSRVEQVKRFVILGRDFSQESGELTPTMKVKRKAVEATYGSTFDRIYADDDFALEPSSEG